MTLESRITACMRLMGEVEKNRVKASADESVTKGNNAFFDRFRDFCILLNSYCIVHTNFGFTVSDDLIEKMERCRAYAVQVFKTQNVSDRRAFCEDVVDLRNELARLWEQFVAELNANRISRLGVLGLVHSDPMEIRRIRTRIDAIKPWPVQEAAVDAYIKAIQQMHALFASLDFDEQVEAFLQKVSEQKATLRDLTDPIMQWIREHEFEDQIGVTIL